MKMNQQKRSKRWPIVGAFISIAWLLLETYIEISNRGLCALHGLSVGAIRAR